MVNRNYNKGRKFEYQVAKEYRAMGYISFRTAGSHSPVDVIAIHPKKKKMFLVQCKHGKIYKPEIARILADTKQLNGTFEVDFILEVKENA